MIIMCRPMTEETASTVTSPPLRGPLRGEVGSRARRGCQVRRKLAPSVSAVRLRSPHPNPLPASPGERAERRSQHSGPDVSGADSPGRAREFH